MMVHLRRKDTKAYYAGRGRWVSGPVRALEFSTIEDALLFNRQEHLRETEIVLHHSNSQRRVILPIGPQPWANQDWVLPPKVAPSSAVQAP